MAATQFQPHHARSTLLSFDEPAMKAKFHISIEHPDDLTALSNQRITKRENLPKHWAKSTFDVTPKVLTLFFKC